MHEYAAVVTQDGPWWMVELPELDGLTQARNVDEIESMAREFIAVTTGIDPSELSIRVRLATSEYQAEPRESTDSPTKDRPRGKEDR